MFGPSITFLLFKIKSQTNKQKLTGKKQLFLLSYFLLLHNSPCFCPLISLMTECPRCAQYINLHLCYPHQLSACTLKLLILSTVKSKYYFNVIISNCPRKRKKEEKYLERGNYVTILFSALFVTNTQITCTRPRKNYKRRRRRREA